MRFLRKRRMQDEVAERRASYERMSVHELSLALITCPSEDTELVDTLLIDRAREEWGR